MSRNNYSAWSNFPCYKNNNLSAKQLLVSVLQAGILAPSTHNTQPWKYTITSKGVIINPVLDLRLPSGDPKDRGLYTSLGCSAMNIIVTAEYYGYSSDISFMEDGGQFSIKINFQNLEQKRLLSPLFSSIRHRFSDKLEYSSRKTDPLFRKMAKKYSALIPDLDVFFVEESEVISSLSEKYKSAAYEMSSDPEFRRELSRWLRPNNTTRYDGMPGFVSGLPLLLSFLGPSFIKISSLPLKIQSIKDSKRLSSSPMVGLIISKNNIIETWIRTGMLYQLIALLATKMGISMTPMAAMVENIKYNDDLRNAFNISKVTPHMFFRLGYSGNRELHTPRRRVKMSVNVF